MPKKPGPPSGLAAKEKIERRRAHQNVLDQINAYDYSQPLKRAFGQLEKSIEAKRSKSIGHISKGKKKK